MVFDILAELGGLQIGRVSFSTSRSLAKSIDQTGHLEPSATKLIHFNNTFLNGPIHSASSSSSWRTSILLTRVRLSAQFKRFNLDFCRQRKLRT